MKRLLPLLLAFAMLLAGCTQPTPTADPGDRATIKFSQMEYARPDLPVLLASLSEIETQAATCSGDELIALYDQWLDLYAIVSTASSLATLNRYLHTSDASAEEEERFMNDLAVDFSTAASHVAEAFLQNVETTALQTHLGDYLYADLVNTIRLNDDSVAELKKQRAQLNTDYNVALSNLTVEDDGIIYTLEDIYNATSYKAYYRLIGLIYETNADTFTDYFRQMIQLDKEIAATLGFESAADMYYLSYSRDYTPADSIALCEYVSEHLAPISDITSSINYYGSAVDLEKLTIAMPSALAQIDSTLANGWQFMREYELYDLEARAEKQRDIAFTTSLPHYDCSFIYTNWEGSFSDANTVIHEYGHFFHDYAMAGKDEVFNLDIAEVHSQGLEMLTLPQIQGITGADAEECRKIVLAGNFDVYLFQPLLEEFTQLAFEMEDFTTDELALLYDSLMEKYGYQSTGSPDYTWYRITHIFDAPFYTISYTTSAAAAIQLYQIMDTDYDAAVDAYLDITTGDPNMAFLEILNRAGLRNVFEEELYVELADLFQRELG